MIKIALTEQEFDILDKTPFACFICLNSDSKRFQDIITNKQNTRYIQHQNKFGNVDDYKI